MRSLEIDDPDLNLSDLMQTWPQTIPVFLQKRMLCVGCLVSPFHTLSDACTAYGLDPEAFLAELQRTLI
jgi:hybrid cluster-associated redox disulfide protein